MCSADCWWLLNRVSPCRNRILLTASRAKHQTHVLFVYLAASLFTKGFAWNVNFLFSPQPALCLSMALLEIQSHSSESVLSAATAGWTALLFRWMRPCFAWRIRQTQTVHVRARRISVENQGLSETASKLLHMCICLCHLLFAWEYGHRELVFLVYKHVTRWSSFTLASLCISASCYLTETVDSVSSCREQFAFLLIYIKVCKWAVGFYCIL